MKPAWADEEAGVWLYRGDALKGMPELSGIAAVVTDPPYGLSPRRKGTGPSRGGPGAGFMGLAWDRDVPQVEFWQAALECCLPGAPLFSFAGCRTYHRTAGRIEEAGWTICNQLFWLFGTGFPKGLAVDKLLDRRRNDRELVLEITAGIRKYRDLRGLSNRDLDGLFGLNGMAGHWTSAAAQPAVPTPEQWEQLRPVLGAPRWLDRLVRKANRLKGADGEWYAKREVVGVSDSGRDGWNAGDGGGWEREFAVTSPASAGAQVWQGWACGMANLKPAAEPICYAEAPLDGNYIENALRHGVAGLWIDGGRVPTDCEHGRHPANVLHDGSPEVLQAFESAGESRSRRGVKRRAASNGYGGFGPQPAAVRGFDDAGSPARFFYCAKPSPAERTAGGRVENRHRTVKPLALMRHLVRLTRQAGLDRGGVVLDPCGGSGTTAVAAIAEGRPVIAFERDAGNFRTMRERVKLAIAESRTAAEPVRRAA